MKERKKLYICFVDLEKAFVRVPRKVIKLSTKKEKLASSVSESSNECMRVQRRKSELDGVYRRNLG